MIINKFWFYCSIKSLQLCLNGQVILELFKYHYDSIILGTLRRIKMILIWAGLFLCVDKRYQMILNLTQYQGQISITQSSNFQNNVGMDCGNSLTNGFVWWSNCDSVAIPVVHVHVTWVLCLCCVRLNGSLIFLLSGIQSICRRFFQF